MLEAAIGAPTGGVGLAANVVPSGPGLFDAVAATGMLGFSEEGTGYLEAAPRGGIMEDNSHKHRMALAGQVTRCMRRPQA